MNPILSQTIDNLNNNNNQSLETIIWFLKEYVGKEWNKLEERVIEADKKPKKLNEYLIIERMLGNCECGLPIIPQYIKESESNICCKYCFTDFCGFKYGCKGTKIFNIDGYESACKLCATQILDDNKDEFEEKYGASLDEIKNYLFRLNHLKGFFLGKKQIKKKQN